ncbi:TonB-dependent receptor plug domain-containing protein [Saccharicrinis sp. FJH62]|uniref:TonB-dependent receptor plug domain-containing protein n=1 Tax=Saccharicrinis sp. FJH62 TaxID=3344657 RepID=UPI0035D44875
MFFITDTLELEAFTIEQPRQHTFDIGNKKVYADTLLLEQFAGSSLNTLLGTLAPLNLKSGGTTGAVSTLSLRGAGGARTLVTWNGIPLNSLTSGDVNLSLLNTSAFNEILLNYTAPSTLYGGNSFGGVVELNNYPKFNPELSAELSQYYGSFKTGSTTAGLKYSTRKLFSQTNLWNYHSKNNFPYFDKYYYKTMDRTYADHSNYGLISNNSIRIGSEQMITAGIWYQDNVAKLPPENGSHPNLKRSNQSDRSFRSYLKWNIEHRDLYVTVKSYYLDEFLLYTQKLAPEDVNYSIYSEIHPVKLGLDADARYVFNDNLTADFGSSVYYNLTKGTNYTSAPSETNLALFSAWRFHLDQLRMVASVRKEFHTQYAPPVRFGFGADYGILNDVLKFRINLNQKYRVPTFNDKYWPGSGNPDLKPETGYTAETGVNFMKRTRETSISADISLYRNDINQMVVWVPAEDGLWRPQNYTSVLSRGIETRAGISTVLFRYLHFKQVASFDLNRSQNDTSDLQLIYTPKYRANTTTILQFRNVSSVLNFSYLSRRRYDESSFTLPEFYTSNIAIQYDIQLNAFILCISGKVNNVLNQTEPYVKDFPVPGRNYLLGLKLKFNHKY